MGEVFAGYIDDLRSGHVLSYHIGDCSQEMGFSESRVAVDIEGIILMSWFFSNGHGRSIGKSV